MIQRELREICEVLVWLDTARWEHISRKGDFINYSKDYKKNLSASKKILTHWICYITDRQMPFEQIWEKGGVVFSDLVDYYMENTSKSSEYILNTYYGTRTKYKDVKEFEFDNELKTNKGKDRYIFVQNRTSIGEKKIYFAPRFPSVDKECIERTLKNLEKYDRDFIKFLVKKVNENKEHDNILVRIACELYFLTYADKPAKKAFEQFNKSKTTNKKRLWAALRDYIKPGSPSRGYLHNGVKELLEKKEITKEEAYFFREKWNNSLLDQLELPGDRWNKDKNFNKKLLGKYINEINTKNDDIHISKNIREFYVNNKGDLKKIDFYPERLDVTFDFVPRMCDKKECDICPFGKEGSNKVCHENDNKLCSVSLVTCGYAIDCKPNECIIQKGVGKNTCTI